VDHGRETAGQGAKIMRNTIILIICFVLISNCSCDHSVHKTVKTRVYCGKLKWYKGTGFFVDTDKLFTAAHIVTKTTNDKVTLIDVINEEKERSREYTFNSTLDTALIKTSEFYCSDPWTLCPNLENVENVHIIGIINDKMKILKTTVQRFADGNIYLNIEISEGYSGAPIIDNKQNCVIGLVSGNYGNIGFGPNVETLYKFMKKSKMRQSTAISK
jgi:hypothetical protein